VIDQDRRRLGHAPCPTRGAEPPSLARERDQLLVGTRVTTHTQEAVGDDAAFLVRLEVILDELRQTRPGVRVDLSEEGLELFLHDPIGKL
jgi:hypothetical protein